jgi:uncharacterized protein
MPAAPPDMEPYRAAWRTRAARQAAAREAATQARRKAAEALLPRLVEHLSTRYGVRRVTLVGSFARGDSGPESDIDLVVEGLPPDALFKAGAELERIAGDWDVDLIPYEDATDRLRTAMAEEGVVIHDAE